MDRCQGYISWASRPSFSIAERKRRTIILIMKKHIKISNVKLRYKDAGSEGLMDSFSLEVMDKLRKTSKILGRKCREGVISKICNQNGYITLCDETTIKPTQARDDKNWFKEVYEDCENKSLPVILIEHTVNRYASQLKRNRKLPKYVEFKKNSVNIKKNYFKYCDVTDTMIVRDLHNNNIYLDIQNKTSVTTHKETFINRLKAKTTNENSKLTSVLWAANMMFDHRLIIPTVKLEIEDLYEAQDFFAVDINKNKANWLQFNMPVNGKTCFPKPDIIAEKENRIRKIQKAINETLAFKPHERKSCAVLFEEKEYKATSPGRRLLRIEWIKAHKELKREIYNLDILKEIEEFIINNELGYAHDNVCTGQSNGTFSQDKLRDYWISRADKVRFPFEIVNPAYTSRECPKCGDRSKKNRDGDEFKCTNCDYENQSHTVGAINIGRKAMKSYSVK